MVVDPTSPEFIEGWQASMVVLASATSTERIPFDDVPIPPKHLTYVQIIRAGGFFASCYSCGPDQFLDRRTLEEAEADARAHGELRHVYSLATLQEHDRGE